VWRRAEEIFSLDIAAGVDHVLRRTQDGEDAAHLTFTSMLLAAVQRVEHQQVLAAGVLSGDLIGVVHLL
jgi:hypothetical protein